MDDINTGYERLAEFQVVTFSHLSPSLSILRPLCIKMGGILQVKKVNGVEVENLKHLRQLVEEGSEENVRFDLDDERVIVLNYKKAKIATSRILKRHRIPSAMSADLIDDEDQTVSHDTQLPSSK